MALSTTALITVDTAQGWLPGLPSADVDVERLIESASRVANTYAQRHLAATDYTERRSGDGGVELLLRQYPVQSITSIHVDGDREFGDDTELTDYEYDEDSGIVYYYDGWPEGVRNIKIVYRAGYEVATMPQDLVSATIEVIAWMQRRITGGQVGTSSHSYGDESITYELTPPTSAQRIFEAYREVRV